MGAPEPLLRGEKESLHDSLDRHRDFVLWKLGGLDEEQLRRPMVSSGSNLLGIVKHLASVEFGWICESFGRPSEWIPWDPDDCDADARVGPQESTADILDFFSRARAASDSVIQDFDIEQVATPPPGLGPGNQVTLRWLLIHVQEHTARHAGQMDILRELIDGQTGDHPR